MKLQELLNDHDIDLSADQARAFFLGVLSAEQPMPVSKAIDELLVDSPEAKDALSGELKTLWSGLEKNLKKELGNIFPQNDKAVAFLETANEQLDYFLTGMSLSGTNTDSCKDEELLEFIEVIEEIQEEMDEYLSEMKPGLEQGEELKEYLLETWEEFVFSK